MYRLNNIGGTTSYTGGAINIIGHMSWLNNIPISK